LQVRGGGYEDRRIDQWGRHAGDERGGKGRGADGVPLEEVVKEQTPDPDLYKMAEVLAGLPE
jgi:hypothetical protein